MSTSDTTSKVGMRSRYLDRLRGSVPERPKGADCKSAGTAFGGSNPPRPTQIGAQVRAGVCPSAWALHVPRRVLASGKRPWGSIEKAGEVARATGSGCRLRQPELERLDLV